MSQKDWLMLLVPIIANGIIIFVLQQWVSRKIEHINKRDALRDNVFKTFWEQSQAYNLFIVKMIKEGRDNPHTLINNIYKLKDLTAEMIAYYDSNPSDLKVVSSEFDKLTASWDNLAKSVSDTFGGASQTQNFDVCLQAVKDANLELSKAIRKKY